MASCQFDSLIELPEPYRMPQGMSHHPLQHLINPDEKDDDPRSSSCGVPRLCLADTCQRLLPERWVTKGKEHDDDGGTGDERAELLSGSSSFDMTCG